MSIHGITHNVLTPQSVCKLKHDQIGFLTTPHPPYPAQTFSKTCSSVLQESLIVLGKC